GITFNSSTFKSYPDVKNTNNQVITPYIWYKFDNDESRMLLDSGTAGFNLTNSGSTFDSVNFTRGNGSLNIALGNYVEITNSIDFRTIQITDGLSFSLWIKMLSTTGQFGRIFEFSNSGQTNFIAILRDNNSANIVFSINNTNYITSGTNFFNDTWYHIVWTISSSGIWNVYVNGIKLAVSVTYSIPSGNTFNNLKRIGRGADIYPADRGAGDIDDFRIYNIALTDSQARQVYDGEINRSYPILKDANNTTINPTAWYKFDNNNLTTDSSGNGYNLTNNGVVLNNSIFVKGDASAYFNPSNTTDFKYLTYSGIDFGSKSFSISVWVYLSENTVGVQYWILSTN
ncbi:MAG TPA: LamG domain-containing protein, partial [Allocoleopsis sp.]